MTIQTSARRRELGDELRRARENAGLSGNQLADRIGWQPSKLSRVERGLNRCTEVEAAMILGYLRTPIAEVNRILALCGAEPDGSWLQAFGNRVPDQLRTLVLQESTATTIYQLELNRVPGLLQTEDYARSLIRQSGLIPEPGIEPRVRARMARQALLRREDAPSFIFYVHEQALTMEVGGPGIMHEQMLHLLFLANQPCVAFRIIPNVAGPHAGLSGSFRLMLYADHHPLVYIEFQNRCLILEAAMDTVAYRMVLGKLADQALSTGQSRSMLADYASHYDRMEAADDDFGDGLAQEQL